MLKVGIRALGFAADTAGRARDAFFPGWQYMFIKVGAERGWQPATRAHRSMVRKISW